MMRFPHAILISLIGLFVVAQSGKGFANVQSYSVIFGAWAIEDQQNSSLGYLEFFEVSIDAPAADGRLFKNAGYFSTAAELDVRVNNLAREAYDFDVLFKSPTSGEQTQGRMLISLKGNSRNILKGSIEIDGRFKLINLVRQEESAPSASTNKVENEEVHDDLPGFGITGPAYRLRNVPEGNNLLVRSAPNRSARIVARLDAFASEILVINCTPHIDHVQFDNTSIEGKRELLGGAWCRIQTPTPDFREGYVLGRYLDPILNR